MEQIGAVVYHGVGTWLALKIQFQSNLLAGAFSMYGDLLCASAHLFPQWRESKAFCSHCTGTVMGRCAGRVARNGCF